MLLEFRYKILCRNSSHALQSLQSVAGNGNPRVIVVMKKR